MMKQFLPDKVKNDLLYLQVETFRKSMNFAKKYDRMKQGKIITFIVSCFFRFVKKKSKKCNKNCLKSIEFY